MVKNAVFPDEMLLETKHFTVSQDCEVPIPAFFILAAKRKIKSIADFSEEELREFALLLKNTRKAMRDVIGIKEVYLFQNEDSEHNFHLWLFPRHAWMEKFGRKIESVRPIMEYAKENMHNIGNTNLVREIAKQIRNKLQQ